MSLNAYERETIIRFSDGDDHVNIWTAQRRVINMLDKDDRYDIIKRGSHEGSDYIEAVIPIDQWSNKFGAKRKVSEEQRESMRQNAKERFGHG